MRLLTYIAAAILLWAVASTGPAMSTPLPGASAAAATTLHRAGSGGAGAAAHVR